MSCMWHCKRVDVSLTECRRLEFELLTLAILLLCRNCHSMMSFHISSVDHCLCIQMLFAVLFRCYTVGQFSSHLTWELSIQSSWFRCHKHLPVSMMLDHFYHSIMFAPIHTYRLYHILMVSVLYDAVVWCLDFFSSLDWLCRMSLAIRWHVLAALDCTLGPVHVTTNKWTSFPVTWVSNAPAKSYHFRHSRRLPERDCHYHWMCQSDLAAVCCNRQWPLH